MAIKELMAAFDRQDYATAAQLLQVLEQDAPQDPWVMFYRGRLQEQSGQLDQAEELYRQILRQTTNVRLTNYLREGIQRVQETERSQRQQLLVQATANPVQMESGCLILEPVDPEIRARVAPGFARLMGLRDLYSARLHLPSRCWRLYRTGPIGALKFYVQELEELEIPAFCASLSQIHQVQVFLVDRLTWTDQEVTARGHIDGPEPPFDPERLFDRKQGAQKPNRDQEKVKPVPSEERKKPEETLSFQWHELVQQVEGLLPIFESVVDIGAWHKRIRKETTQDYVHLLDLHLPQRNIILRLSDRTYQFTKPEPIPLKNSAAPGTPSTNRQNWNHLVTALREVMPAIDRRSDFTHFMEAAWDQEVFLKQVKPRMDLARIDSPRELGSLWDSAFHLYSSLALIQKQSETNKT